MVEVVPEEGETGGVQQLFGGFGLFLDSLPLLSLDDRFAEWKAGFHMGIIAFYLLLLVWPWAGEREVKVYQMIARLPRTTRVNPPITKRMPHPGFQKCLLAIISGPVCH